MKRVRVFLCGAMLFCLPAYAGMGMIHKIDPNTTRSAWATAVRQGTFIDQATPIALLNSAAVDGVIVISSSGNYKIVEDLTCRIVITASYVALDLGTHRASLAVGSQNVIAIANNLTNISIFDGYIHNTDVGTSGGSGVYIGAGCSKISLRDITFYGCTNGVLCAGSNGSQVFESEFIGLNFMSNVNGLALSYADANVVRECNAMNCTQTGFSLSNCQSNCVEDCVALKTQGTGTVAGFQSSAGTSNLFQRCVTKQTKTSSTTYGDKACGFLLTSSEVKTKIVDCIVNETDVVSSPTAMTYGIHLSPTYNGSISEMTGFPLTTGIVVRWSPDMRYLAVGFAPYGLDIYSWNGTSLTYLSGISFAIVVRDIVWSPDVKYLCVSGGSGNSNIATYSFNGTTLTLLGAPLNTGMTVAQGLSFSPHGKYIVVGGFYAVQLYSFTPSLGAPLVQLQSLALSPSIGAARCEWSPDGQYFVVGASNVYVYKVYPEGTMALIATYPFVSLTARWSPCGKYITAADNTGTVKVLSFDGTILSDAAQLNGLSNSILAMDWSPDGKYIVAAGGNVGDALWVIAFTGTALSVVGQLVFAGQCFYVHWSSDGKYIVACETGTNIHMLNVMYGPQNCFIDNCRVCDTQASNFNMGRGIVFGGNNVCVRSACGNNNVNYSWGIPNVYDGKFEILRDVVQPYDNVSIPELL